ncbi:MAG: hypothetical protein A3H27_12335 [Acidobacteria bacterium RIFCSPLOWO2_02_FULL_59_13]|nr:MAG: hypothetical protein A3H27_12335 [Acidobacteria bacterium RIFCSPLOWO2_02_FULL_59_13]
MSESRGRRLSLIHPQQVDRIPVSKQIIFHDAEGIPRGAVSAEQCDRLVQAGLGRAIRSRKGEIKRFICYPRCRVYFEVREAIAALHSTSRTTRPVRADGTGAAAVGQVLGHPRLIREHKPLKG